MRATPDFIFLRAFTRFRVEEPAFLFAADARLFCLESSGLLKFLLVRRFGRTKLLFDVGAARLFHGVHPTEFFLDTLQLFFSDPATGFLSRTFAGFGFNAKLLLLGALQRRLFLLQSPARSLLLKSMFRSQTHCLEFRAASLLFTCQARQLTFELGDFFGDR